MKIKIYLVLEYFDNTVNHNFVENILDIFVKQDNGVGRFSYWLWKHTCCALCGWVNIDVHGWAYGKDQQ